MIIFLYGEDGFRARRKLNEFKEKFLREIDPSGSSLTVLDGEKTTMEKLNESISPSSLLSKKRMVIIENLFTNKSQPIFNQVKEFFNKRKTSDNIIVFLDNIKGGEKLPKYKSDLFKMLAKEKYAQEFKLLSNTEAEAWTKKEVEGRGGKISREAARELTSLLGSDLWQINNEINKLVNFKAGQKLNIAENEKGVEISVEDVKKMVRSQFDENIFALTDAISNKNKAAAAALLEEQLEAGLTESYLLNMTIRQFKILLQIRQALDTGLTSRSITTTLKLHPFIVQKGIGQARNFTLPVLKNIFSQLVNMDCQMKSGKGEIKPMLSLLIAKI